MRTCLIHFGLHKTGSSSIQKFLRHELRDPRFFYPVSSENSHLRDNCHNRPLCCAFRNDPGAYHTHRQEGASLQELRRRGAWFMEQVRRGACSDTFETIILSAEEISNFRQDELSRLLDFLRSLNLDLAAQGYVRKFKPLQESRFQQATRQPGPQGHVLSLETKYLRIFPYRAKLEKFVQLLGPASAGFAEFSKAASSENGIVDDFCRRAGIAPQAMGFERQNTSLSLDALRLLFAYRRFNSSFVGGAVAAAANKRLVERLARLEGARPAFHSSHLLKYKSEWQPAVDWVSELLGEDMLGDLYADDDADCLRCDADLFLFSPRSLEWLASESQTKFSTLKAGDPHVVANAVRDLKSHLVCRGRRKQWTKRANVVRGKLVKTPAARRARKRVVSDYLQANPQIQFTEAEALLVSAAVRQYPACRLLIFGAGHDSVMWNDANAGGQTVFLEHNPDWIEKVRQGDPSLEVRSVEYTTRITKWRELVENPRSLQMNLPRDIHHNSWDVVLVDAPNGFAMVDAFPKFGPIHGRMQSIHAASQLASVGGYIFVHDAEREVEAACCEKFLSPSFRELFRFRQRKNNARLTELRCYFAGSHTARLPWRARYLQLLALWLRIRRMPDRQERWKGIVTKAQ